jgi:4'-phosphopantetheinyl transferase
MSPLPAPDETDLWRTRLDVAPDDSARLAALLSADERRRADGFPLEADRVRFVAMRGQLREVLAAYLDASPGALAFEPGARGKLRLAGAGAPAGLTFSMAETGDHALIAVARGREIGVDLEEVRPGVLGDAEVALMLSPAERHAIDRLDPPERLRALSALWVQKEAYAKARGDGLADAGEGWSLRMLDAGPDFAAALVVEGAMGRVRWAPVTRAQAAT